MGNKMSRFISISFFFFAIICYINAKSLKQHVKDVKQDLQTLKTFFHVPETRTIQIQNNLQQDEIKLLLLSLTIQLRRLQVSQQLATLNSETSVQTAAQM